MYRNNCKVLCLSLWAFMNSLALSAQQTVSVKNNLLYDATLTPNLGVEVKTGSHSSVQLFYGWNPWKFSNERRWRHWSLMPEYRQWLGKEGAFKGWFVGVHALGGEYNVSNIHLPFGLYRQLRDHRYEGWYAGGGLTAGYAWRLSCHWRLEAVLGVGMLHYKHDKYVNEVCGDHLGNYDHNYVGPTKLALNIAYAFGKTPECGCPVQPQPEVKELYAPDFHFAYVTPQAEAQKVRELNGKAFLDFPVNKTDIRPDYRGNKAELEKVHQTVNVVRDDPNTTITHVSIHGYASPEGSFANNTRLAEGRAQAFSNYVQALILLPADIFDVTSTPEDWNGLIVRMDHMEELSGIGSVESLKKIRDIAKSDLSPDQKEAKLKQQFPTEWHRLVTDIFPALRHSDYQVSYTVRPFSVEEAKAIIATKPQQLSLNEMFLVANTYPIGSQEYNEVFETAVRMYPNDETANLNAAVIALQKNDLAAAERYLAKAGNNPEAQNARGILAIKQGDLQTAESILSHATGKEALHNLGELKKYINSIQ